MYQTKHFDFKAYGAFFAFGQKQFDEQKVEGVEYVADGTGLIMPKNRAKEIIEAQHNRYVQEAKNRLEADGIDNIIKFELNNHECYYTGDISPLEFLIDEYGITWDKIRDIFKAQSLLSNQAIDE